MQALARAISNLPAGVRISVFNALSDEALNLRPRDGSELFNTLILLASDKTILPRQADRERGWRRCFDAVTGRIEASAQGRALVTLATSYTDCLNERGRQRAFEEITSAVAKLDAIDPEKGRALGQLLLGLPQLPYEYRATALAAILPMVTQLDDRNPQKGWALHTLSKEGADVEPLNWAFIESVLESVTGLPRGDKEKGETLVAIASYSYRCYGSQPMKIATFNAILHALAEFDGAESCRSESLFWLTSSVERLAKADRATAVTALVYAPAVLSNDKEAILGIANAMAEVPSPTLKAETFHALLQTVGKLDIAFRHRATALISLAKSVGRLPESARLAAFQAVQREVVAENPGDGARSMALTELLKIIPLLPPTDAPAVFKDLLPAVRSSHAGVVPVSHDADEHPLERQAELYSALRDAIRHLPGEYRNDASQATTGW